MLYQFFWLLFCSILITGCFTTPVDSSKTSSNTPSLEKSVTLFNTWEIISLSSSSLYFQGPAQNNEAHGNRPLKITFFKENSIDLNLSTNNCGLGYTLEEDKIAFQKNITCTEACCDSNEDQVLMTQLSDTLKYYIKGDTLTIQAKEGPIQWKLSPM